MSPSTPASQPARGTTDSRPRSVDYLFILLGCSLSLILTEMSGLKAVRPASALPAMVEALINIFPHLLFLPMGMILFWPLFYLVQRITGRQQAMSVGEWLWGLAWLVTVVLAVWIMWKALGTLPAFMAGRGFQRGVIVGHVIFVLSLAVIALVVALIDLVGRWPQTWTHQFSLVLLMWPALPLAGLWAWNIKLE